MEPAAAITEQSERRQASLISAILFILTVTMISGVIYMGFFSTNPAVGIVLAGADFFTGIAYLLSRTRHYRWAAILSLVILAFIPIMNVTLSTDRSSEALLIMLIWNTLTILISSATTSTRNTVLFAIINVLTLLLLPAIIPAVTYIKMVLPLIFNIVISIMILVFTRHRNMLEKDRIFEISQINKQLQIELNERKRAEDQLVHIALHDALTNLPNRVLFMDRLQHAMQRANRNKDYLYAVLFIDLDRFKVVNDSLGHNIGDHLLIETGKTT